jgi:hypothetical protein
LGFYFSVKSNDNGPAQQVEVKTNLLNNGGTSLFLAAKCIFGE